MDDRRDGATDPTADAGPTTNAEPAPGAGRTSTSALSQGTPSDSGAPSRDEMSIAFTPGQLAVGGAVVAGLLVVGARLLLGRRRGRD